MPTEAMMKHVAGPFWFAHPSRFVAPGLYFVRKGNKRILPLPPVPEPMQLVEFPEQNVVYAKEQPEYRPLPAHKFNDPSGTIACCWKLNWFERIKVLMTGKIWHRILTFNHPLQPQLLSVDKPDMPQEIKPSEPWPRK